MKWSAVRSQIGSRYVNGWTIYRALQQLPITPDAIREWRFFTDERGLLAHWADGLQGRTRFKPRDIDPALIDDKWALYERLRVLGETPVQTVLLPETRSARAAFVFPLVLKARHSWRGERKLPKGWVIGDAAALEARLCALDREGLPRDWFVAQRVIPGYPANNTSVSGYVDWRRPQRNLLWVTRKCAGDAAVLSTGVVIETIADPAGLRERTAAILTALRYDGPFELEFLHDAARGAFDILELNPRFWMQHGLFWRFADNGLLKRYLDLDDARDWVPRAQPRAAWVNAIDVILCAMRGDAAPLRAVLRLRREGVAVLFAPTAGTALKHVAGQTLYRLFGLQWEAELF